MKKIVLIDDDKLICMSWNLKAKKSGIELLAFTNINEFLDRSNEIPFSTPIYIDSSLGNNIKGEVDIKRVILIFQKCPGLRE